MAERIKPLIIGNWKMNGDKNAWQNLSASIAQNADKVNNQVDLVVCPPLAALGVVAEALWQHCSLQNQQVKLGAQNFYPGEDGAVTGEVNASMLRSMGCAYVIIGHSERRTLFSETDAFVAQKAEFALEAGLKPVVCVGEGEDTTDTDTFLEQQLTASLSGVKLSHLQAEKADDLIIAYEPIWAIGTGKTATPEIIDKTTTTLRNILITLYGTDVGGRIRILYGGSMKAENAAEIMAVTNVSGGLIGGASLKADAFISLAKNV